MPRMNKNYTFQFSCVLPFITSKLPFASRHLFDSACFGDRALDMALPFELRGLLGVMTNIRSAPRLKLTITYKNHTFRTNKLFKSRMK